MRGKTLFFFLTVSLVFALAVGIYASFYCRNYYSGIAYAPDPLDGLMRNEKAFYNVETNGRISAFLQEFKENNRSFLCIAPLILLAPEILQRPDAHLFILIPLIFLFVFLLSYSVWLRTKNIVHAFVVALFYITCYAVTEPYFGIGFNMPDTIAGYPAGIAALCLLIWSEKKETRWLILFAIFLSFSVLTRFIFTVYSFLLFSFPLFLIFREQFRLARNNRKEISKALLLIGGIVSILCINYIITHFDFNMQYYSYWLHSKKETMNIGIIDSAYGFLYMYGGFLRKIHAIFLILLFAANFYFFEIDKKIFRRRLLLAAWMFFILPFYWVIILKTNGRVVGSAFMAAFPVMFLCLALPLNNIVKNNRKKIFTYLLLAICAASLVDLVISVKKNSGMIAMTNLIPEPRKSLSINLSDWLNTISPRDCTLSLIVFSGNHLAEDISLESFYRNGRYIKTTTSEKKFLAYSNFTDDDFPNADIDAIKNSLYQKVVNSNNLFIFFKERLQSDSVERVNPISMQVERGLFEKFSSETAWKMIEVPDSSMGPLILFYKKYLFFPSH